MITDLEYSQNFQSGSIRCLKIRIEDANFLFWWLLEPKPVGRSMIIVKRRVFKKEIKTIFKVLSSRTNRIQSFWYIIFEVRIFCVFRNWEDSAFYYLRRVLNPSLIALTRELPKLYQKFLFLRTHVKIFFSTLWWLQFKKKKLKIKQNWQLVWKR